MALEAFLSHLVSVESACRWILTMQCRRETDSAGKKLHVFMTIFGGAYGIRFWLPYYAHSAITWIQFDRWGKFVCWILFIPPIASTDQHEGRLFVCYIGRRMTAISCGDQSRRLKAEWLPEWWSSSWYSAIAEESVNMHLNEQCNGRCYKKGASVRFDVEGGLVW